MKVEVKISGLDGVLDTLRSLPPEVVNQRGGPVRRAVARAAVLIRNQARANFDAVTSQPGKTGVNHSTGFTRKHIITKRKFMTRINGERFIVAVRYIKHPSSKVYIASRPKAISSRSKKRKPRGMTKAKMLKANDVAFMLEYGTSAQPAEPWLRPAYEAKKSEAMQTMQNTLLKDIDAIVRKLANKNRGR